jgi:hypothetical protein
MCCLRRAPDIFRQRVPVGWRRIPFLRTRAAIYLPLRPAFDDSEGLHLRGIGRWPSKVVRSPAAVSECVLDMGQVLPTQRPCRFCAFRHAVIVVHSQPVAPVLCQSGELRLRPAAFIGIFLAVDRCNMRRIPVEIRSPDPKLLFVRIDPLPQDFAPLASLQTCLPLHADEISRKPMAIAAAATPAMV